MSANDRLSLVSFLAYQCICPEAFSHTEENDTGSEWCMYNVVHMRILG